MIFDCPHYLQQILTGGSAKSNTLSLNIDESSLTLAADSCPKSTTMVRNSMLIHSTLIHQLTPSIYN